MRTNHKKPQAPPTPKHASEMLRSMLANLIGDTNRLHEMAGSIRYADIPEDLPFERDVMRVLWYCAEKSITPNADQVATGLVTLCNRGVDKAHSDVQELLQSGTVDRDVWMASNWFVEELRKAAADLKWKEALAVYDSPVGAWEERHEQALSIIASIDADDDGSQVRMGDREGLKDFVEYQIRKHELYLEGGAVGAQLPWREFRGGKTPTTGEEIEGIIPVLEDGDLTMITARPGFGKSTIVGQVAEHNAWQLGNRVLLIHMENNPRQLRGRSLARNMFIPYSDWKTGRVDPREEPYRSRIERYDHFVETQARAEVVGWFAPGLDFFKLLNGIKLERRIAQEHGQRLLVIIDYLQKLNTSRLSENKVEALGTAVRLLKEVTQAENIRSPVHTILMAQETTNDKGETYAFGASESLQHAQIHIQFVRKLGPAGHDIDVMIWDQGEGRHIDAKDARGRVRRYQSARDKYLAECEFRVLKANDGATRNVTCWFENNMFKIHDDPTSWTAALPDPLTVCAN